VLNAETSVKVPPISACGDAVETSAGDIDVATCTVY
jgi:hypothetical protein